MIRIIRLIVIFGFLFSFELEGNPARAKQTNPESSRVSFLHEWDLTGRGVEKLRVEILRLPRAKGEVLPPYRVRILNGAKLLYSKVELGAEPVHIVNIENNKVMIVWRAASPYLFLRVFGYRNGKILPLLKTGSRAFPEIVYPAESLENSTQNLDARIITLEQADSFEGKYVPTDAVVYKFDRKKFAYSPGEAVEWNKRLLVK
ncbi:MAG: hypothetical protein WCT03_09090 [Candidatus Obscuribacterales bacterium]